MKAWNLCLRKASNIRPNLLFFNICFLNKIQSSRSRTFLNPETYHPWLFACKYNQCANGCLNYLTRRSAKLREKFAIVSEYPKQKDGTWWADPSGLMSAGWSQCEEIRLESKGAPFPEQWRGDCRQFASFMILVCGPSKSWVQFQKQIWTLLPQMLVMTWGLKLGWEYAGPLASTVIYESVNRMAATWAPVPLLMALISVLEDKVPAVPGPVYTILDTLMCIHLIWKYFWLLINNHMPATDISAFTLSLFWSRQMLC